jgi:hypothetical protein
LNREAVYSRIRSPLGGLFVILPLTLFICLSVTTITTYLQLGLAIFIHVAMHPKLLSCCVTLQCIILYSLPHPDITCHRKQISYLFRHAHHPSTSTYLTTRGSYRVDHRLISIYPLIYFTHIIHNQNEVIRCSTSNSAILGYYIRIGRTRSHRRYIQIIRSRRGSSFGRVSYQVPLFWTLLIPIDSLPLVCIL